MARKVVKFGGTSVGDFNKIKNVAKIVKKLYDEDNELIVVVSSMTGVTNDLIKKSQSVSSNFDKSEYDVLLSSGEQISSALVSGALLDIGLKARSWLNWQIPIITDTNYSSAKILGIDFKVYRPHMN